MVPLFSQGKPEGVFYTRRPTAWLYRLPAAQPPGHRAPWRLGLTAPSDRRVAESPVYMGYVYWYLPKGSKLRYV